MLCHEPWIFEFEAFDGGWSLADCADGACDSAALICVAHMLVVRVVASAIRQQIRGEDLHDDIMCTLEYLDGLPFPPADARAFVRLLDALNPFDPARVTEGLLTACALACAQGREGSARGLAELAYEAATAQRLEASAHGAALALAHLAKVQEAPWSRRKWRAIARMHGRRIRAGRFPGR